LGDFRITGSTSAFTIVIAIECYTDWISDYAAHLDAHDLETIEATEETETRSATPASRRLQPFASRKKRQFQDVATEALVPLVGITVLLQAKRVCDPDHRQGFILVIFHSIGG
jgi:hypothetical protein